MEWEEERLFLEKEYGGWRVEDPCRRIHPPTAQLENLKTLTPQLRRNNIIFAIFRVFFIIWQVFKIFQGL